MPNVQETKLNKRPLNLRVARLHTVAKMLNGNPEHMQYNVEWT